MSTDKDIFIYKGVEIHFNYYDEGEYTVYAERIDDDCWFATQAEAEKYIDEMLFAEQKKLFANPKMIVLATNNRNKVREFKEILEPKGYKVVCQADLGVDLEVEETGSTYAENALLKAQALYNVLKIPVVAEDSGLEVDALNGAPGVYTARFAPDNNYCERLLSAMQDKTDRTAQYVCCLVYIDGEGIPISFQDVCKGAIGTEQKGTKGFAYDPIFMINGKSIGEMTPAQKNKISHRVKAIKALTDYLENSRFFKLNQGGV